jgi:hypothetical protein
LLGDLESVQLSLHVTKFMQEIAERDSTRLFNSGGCHIFAVTLQVALPGEKYELVRVSRSAPGTEKGAHHVYARSGRLIVDIGGIKAEDDYLAWLRAAYTEVIGLHHTDRGELYEITSEDPDLGPSNRWGLCVDAGFIGSATERALALISESRRYSASLVFAGEDIVNFETEP